MMRDDLQLKERHVGDELEKMISQGGRAHKVRTQEGRAVDSMLAVYRDRVTFTFVMDAEVASIHFDKARQEIFFKGHNIAGGELNPKQIDMLWRLKEVLAADVEGKTFEEAYGATLARVVADNYKG